MKTLVCTLLSKNTLFLLCLLSMLTSYGQELTITSSGQTGTSGTNWSISSNTLTVTGNASIQASVIVSHLTNTGPLTIVGNTTPSNLQVSVNEAINVSSGNNSLVIGASDNKGGITTTQTITLTGSISFHGGWVRLENNVETTGSGAKILAKANEPVLPVNATDGFISLSLGKNLTTNGGDIILWSNATNRTAASGQANNEIILLGTNTLSTSGGKIVFAGGDDDGSNGGTASDGIPDGYAYRGSYGGRPIDIKASVTLNSGGGEIIIRGEQDGSDAAVGADATFTISNGGAVTIEGKNTTATSVVLGTANITSTATNAPVTISGTTHITNSGLTTISTQGGDVLLASNVDDATDNETTTNGYIKMGSGLSVTTNGGDITIGGGDATGSGYALGRTDDDSYTEGVRVDATLNLNSGGGDIGIRGKSSTRSLSISGAGNAGFGVFSLTSAGEINSGTGTITIEGINQNPNQTDYSSGIVFALNGGNAVTIRSANTTANAISISASAIGPNVENFGMEVETNSPLSVAATGSGGGITLTTSQASTAAGEYDFVVRSPLDILANGGPITLSGSAGGIWYVGPSIATYLGSRASSLVATSSSAITVEFDRYDFNSGSPNVGTSGAVTVRPASTSFGAAFSSSGFSWNQNSQTMSGLTIGKSTNTADVTISNAIDIAGPITVYGGDIAVNENLNTSGGAADGDVLLKASGNNNLANSKSITTSGGDVTFWSDSDGNGTGYAQVGSSTAITTTGGNITLGGGSDIATGYARGGADNDGVTDINNYLHVSGVHLKNGASLSSGGGNITLRGQNYPSSGSNAQSTNSFGVMGHNATLDAGSGKVAIIGKATGSGTTNSQAIGVYGNGWTIRSSNSDADAIVLNGDGSGYNGNTTSLGINFAGIIESTGGGGIQITGKSGTAAGYDHPLDMYGSILANSGTITITAENNNATQSGLLLSGATFGFKAATNVTASTSNIILKSDNTVFNSTTNLNTTGAVSLLPLDASTSFGVAQTIGSNMVLSSGVSGLTIGKSGNTANITMAQTQTIAGPIEVHGGTLTLNTNLTTTNGGDISLYTDNNLGGLSSVRTITADGSLKLIPNSTSFSSNISFPITNLNVSSNGLTIGKSGNTANITMAQTQNIAGPIEVHGGTLALDNNITCTNIELSGTATLANGKYISASGNMTNNGTLNLSASSSGYSQLKVGGTITNSGSGTISQSQYIGSTGHHGISSPMIDGFTTTSGTSSALYGYDASTGAWNMSPTTTSAGAGFFAPVQASNGFQSAVGTFSVTGTPNTSHTHSLGYAANTATGGSGSGWNLIGNPYTCGLDWTSVTKTNVNNAYYVWDAPNGTYQYYSGSALTGTYLAASSILSGVIPPMQAFWVQTTASGGSIVSTMASDGTVASSPTFYKTAPDNLILYAEDLNDPSLSDAMWITHAAGYTNDFEGDQDAWKRTNYGGQANIYSYHDGEKLAINAMDLSSTTSIPVGVGAPEAGRKYRIVLEQLVNNQAYQVVLEDKLMNSFTDITSEGYVFTYGPWQNEDPRFVLHINQSTVGMGEQTAPEVKVYQQGDRLVIHGEAQKHSSYTLLSADGRILETGSLSAGMVSIKAPQGGMYIIQIDGVSPVAQRIVIQ